ncbi:MULTISPECIES: lytic transglycosylase domain-containing protein [Sphingomonas]|uniref:Murein transglycosylase n=2 Tax=Sphingomonas TaxID=13687 RepID=A0A1E3LRM2_9SPHN|nr:lytic transglycosylase domain-containing protein [Sphingomonas turrisvirgatae]ODP36396.1 murein transglycosylase [Sphingomonas turrisvirgatae]
MSKHRAAQEQLIGQCIKAASGHHGWLEKTLWGLRDQEGGWIGAKIANRDGSHDLGPLQINSWWISKFAAATGKPAPSIRWWLTHDACFNVSAARWIFLSGLALTSDYWKAVGTYHSPTAWRQRRYALSVAARLRKRFGLDVFKPRQTIRIKERTEL